MHHHHRSAGKTISPSPASSWLEKIMQMPSWPLPSISWLSMLSARQKKETCGEVWLRRRAVLLLLLLLLLLLQMFWLPLFSTLVRDEL